MYVSYVSTVIGMYAFSKKNKQKHEYEEDSLRPSNSERMERDRGSAEVEEKEVRIVSQVIATLPSLILYYP